MNSLFIVVTITAYYLTSNPYIKTFIDRPLSLAHEMSYATWWSGICLLLAALLMYEQFLSSSHISRLSWLILALAFTVLSLDEIGSIHERLHWIERWPEIKFFLYLMLIVLVVSVFTLYLKKETRKTAIIILAGFGLYFIAVLFELLEQLSTFPVWAAGLRLGAEEGAELFGTFLVLVGIMLHKEPSGQSEILSVLPEPKKLKGLLTIVIVSLIIHISLCYLLPQQVDLSRQGNPLVWLPMVVFFLMFCQACWNWRHKVYKWEKRWGVAAILFLLCSANTNYPILRIIPKILRILNLEQVQWIFYLFACAATLIFFRRLIHSDPDDLEFK